MDFSSSGMHCARVFAGPPLSLLAAALTLAASESTVRERSTFPGVRQGDDDVDVDDDVDDMDDSDARVPKVAGSRGYGGGR